MTVETLVTTYCMDCREVMRSEVWPGLCDGENTSLCGDCLDERIRKQDQEDAA